LKARLLADPRATLTEETGLTIPKDWELVAREAADGTVRVELTNENIPEEYLQLVSGGAQFLSRCADGVERYIGY
jgi:hypothetical protein